MGGVSEEGRGGGRGNLDGRNRTVVIAESLFWRGLGRGKFTENCPKTMFFLGNSMRVKFGHFAKLIVRNVVVIWEAPIFGAEIPTKCGCGHKCRLEGSRGEGGEGRAVA